MRKYSKKYRSLRQQQIKPGHEGVGLKSITMSYLMFNCSPLLILASIGCWSLRSMFVPNSPSQCHLNALGSRFEIEKNLHKDDLKNKHELTCKQWKQQFNSQIIPLPTNNSFPPFSGLRHHIYANIGRAWLPTQSHSPFQLHSTNQLYFLYQLSICKLAPFNLR